MTSKDKSSIADQHEEWASQDLGADHLARTTQMIGSACAAGPIFLIGPDLGSGGKAHPPTTWRAELQLWKADLAFLARSFALGLKTLLPRRKKDHAASRPFQPNPLVSSSRRSLPL